MEKRVLLAIVLSFLVLVLYQAVFVKKKPLPESQPEQLAEVEKKPDQQIFKRKPAIPTESPQEAAPVEEKRSLEPVSGQSEEQILIDTSLYQAVWSNSGGVLKSWKLKKHKDENMEDLELVSLLSSETNIYPFFLSTGDSTFDDTINTALYKYSDLKLVLENNQTGELHFHYADSQGIEVEKIFTFHGGKYDFDVKINAWKNGQKIEPQLLWGPGFGNPSAAEVNKRFGARSGVAVFTSAKVFHQEEIKFNPEKNVFNFVRWAAYENNYFAALFLTSSQKASAAFLKEETVKPPLFFLSVSSPQKVYIGPKEFDALLEFGHGAKKLIKFGLFGWISEILLRAVKAIHNVFPNWGFSIILLTLIIKILFFPLTYSSTRSMAKMQELQPKIKAMRAKHKKAKQDIAQRRKMNEEMMKLYKEHGVNPAGGCLPMLIQIPIFWGFFRLLVIAIEFRHSPFIFWIKDLSVKDPFYVTPILMGATQFISQKMTPTSADPTQARMMLIMPVIMTVFFMNFQSGLVLYWLANNALQIGQQYIINRLTKKKKMRESHGKRRKK